MKLKSLARAEEAPTTKWSALFSSSSDEWPTEQAVVDAWTARGFRFALDVAATHASKKAPRCYTIEQDALVQPWAEDADGGCAWMNPPYSDVGPFVDKAIAEAAKGLTTVMLLPARTCRTWFHRCLALNDKAFATLRGDDIVRAAFEAGVTTEIHFALGRLRFGDATADAPFPSVVVVVRGPK